MLLAAMPGRLVFSPGAAAESAPLRLISLHTAADTGRVRIMAFFNKKPDYDTLLLARPARLVLNLPVTEFAMTRESVDLKGFLKDLRFGMISHDRSRMVLTMRAPFRLQQVRVEPVQNHIWQLVIDLAMTTQKEFEAALLSQSAKREPARLDETPAREQQHLAGKPFTVVLDAGHGDFDSGAMGVSGALEKDITLAFARKLRDILQENPAIKTYLTRDDDVFLRLNERVNMARNHGADLFISIHADHIDVQSQRGATVYTLSDKASDRLARILAEHENKADLLDGLPPDEPPEVTDILIDLTRRETHAFSMEFAENVINTLKKADIKLIKNPHRYAGFQVLRAADVPSVLIELGYLSNPEDEKLIADPQWREQLARLIAGSIRDYADLHRRHSARR